MTMPDAALLELLAEVDLPADDALGEILEEIRALGAGPAPVPAPAVAELLTGSGARRRGRRHRRGAVIGVLVLVSLGTGVTAAAADPDVRAGAADAVAAVVHVVRAEPVHPVARHTPVPAASDPVLVGEAAAPR
jgi:hypothetical protein